MRQIVKERYKELVEDLWFVATEVKTGKKLQRFFKTDDIENFIVYFITTWDGVEYRIVIEPDTFSVKKNGIERTYKYYDELYSKLDIESILKSIEDYYNGKI